MIEKPIPLVNCELIRCRRFEIVDKFNSNVRAFIDTLDGEMTFVLCNEDGLRAVEIRAGAEHCAQIALIDNGHTSRLGLALAKNGNVLLSLLDSEGRKQYHVEVDALGVVDVWPSPNL